MNHIISVAPGVGFRPKNESEIQDQKATELHHAVWRDAVERQDLDDRIDNWADDFVGIGEVAVKIFFDPTKGPIKAFNQAVDEAGNPLTTPSGMPVPGEPIFMGDFVFEDIHGFNLLRAPEAKSMEASPVIIVRKMVKVEELKKQFASTPDKERMIVQSMDETMMVFDSGQVTYRKAAGETMLREYYFRPCTQYPRGYFFFATKEGVLAEGELPGGIFPIVFKEYDRIQTTPRGRSPVKVMRPYQAEINRSASKIAEHQITLGDDKLLIQNGTKISSGVSLPGVRSINFTGMPPEILAGRSGNQYLEYLTSQIAELYDVMNVNEDPLDKKGQINPYSLLFRSANQKKKFRRHVRKFEAFLKGIAKTYLALAKIHMDDEAVVLAVGRRERVNIPEFKNADDISYELIIEPQAEDIETKLGKQLAINQVIQYTASQLDKEDIGKLIRAMPYSNVEETTSDLTMDYDNGTNTILAIERGEEPLLTPYDNHVYMIRRLVSRVRQPDFKHLHPQIQQVFLMTIQAHQKGEAENQRRLQAMQQGYIPTGGYLVTCDFYVPTPDDPKKTRRARIPYEALKWLLDRLQAQGQSLDELEKMNQGALAEMSGMLLQRLGGAPQEAAALPQPGGVAIPQGV